MAVDEFEEALPGAAADEDEVGLLLFAVSEFNAANAAGFEEDAANGPVGVEAALVVADDAGHGLDKVAVAADDEVEGDAGPGGRHLGRQTAVVISLLVGNDDAQPAELRWENHHVSEDSQEERLQLGLSEELVHHLLGVPGLVSLDAVEEECHPQL